MTKNKTATYNLTLILLIMIALLTGVVVTAMQKGVISVTSPKAAMIKSSAGLNQASDELETVNVDSVDVGLNQLGAETF